MYLFCLIFFCLSLLFFFHSFFGVMGTQNRLVAGLKGLPALDAFYCLWVRWIQWRPPDILKHPSSTQSDAVVNYSYSGDDIHCGFESRNLIYILFYQFSPLHLVHKVWWIFQTHHLGLTKLTYKTFSWSIQKSMKPTKPNDQEPLYI